MGHERNSTSIVYRSGKSKNSWEELEEASLAVKLKQ